MLALSYPILLAISNVLYILELTDHWRELTLDPDDEAQFDSMGYVCAPLAFYLYAFCHFLVCMAYWRAKKVFPVWMEASIETYMLKQAIRRELIARITSIRYSRVDMLSSAEVAPSKSLFDEDSEIMQRMQAVARETKASTLLIRRRLIARVVVVGLYCLTCMVFVVCFVYEWTGEVNNRRNQLLQIFTTFFVLDATLIFSVAYIW